jgi:hypothetical protein
MSESMKSESSVNVETQVASLRGIGFPPAERSGIVDRGRGTSSLTSELVPLRLWKIASDEL